MQISQRAISAFQSAYAPGKPSHERITGAFDLFRFGFVDNARDIVSHFKERRATPRSEWLRQVCERAEIYYPASPVANGDVESQLFEGLKEPIEVRAPSDVMILRAPEAKQTLISFGGANSAFWLPPPVLNLSGTNIIALRDDRRLWHLGGVRGLGGNYEDTLAGLQRLTGELGAEKTFIVGCSSGGYAALRYALDLEPGAVLAISPMVGHDDIPSLLPKFPGLRPLMRTVPGMPVDLRPLYQSHPNPPKVTIAWGGRHQFDNQQATRMRGLPNVTLMPVPGISAHAVWLKLLSDQALEPLLLRAFAT